MANKHNFMFFIETRNKWENAFTRKGRQENYCSFDRVSVDRNRSNWVVDMLPVKFATFFYPLLGQLPQECLLAHSCY